MGVAALRPLVFSLLRSFLASVVVFIFEFGTCFMLPLLVFLFISFIGLLRVGFMLTYSNFCGFDFISTVSVMRSIERFSASIRKDVVFFVSVLVCRFGASRLTSPNRFYALCAFTRYLGGGLEGERVTRRLRAPQGVALGRFFGPSVRESVITRTGVSRVRL